MMGEQVQVLVQAKDIPSFECLRHSRLLSVCGNLLLSALSAMIGFCIHFSVGTSTVCSTDDEWGVLM